MTTYYAKAAGSVLAANAWNTAADGSGTDATFADGNAAGHTLDLNALAMTSPNGTTLTCTLLQSGATNAGGTLTPTGTLTIAGKVKYTHTSTSGMIIVGASAALTVNPAAAGNAVENTSTGYAIVSSSTGTVTITNTGYVAIANTSSGRGLQSGATGAFAVTGEVNCSGGSGNAVYVGANSTSTITGNVVATNGNGLNVSSTGSITVDGNFSSTGAGQALNQSAGTVVWTGARTCTTEAYLLVAGGTFNITSLVLSVSGIFVLRHTAGTVTVGSGGTLATITLTASTGCAAIIGKDATTSFSLGVTGPTLPAAADVQSDAADYGYSGELLAPSYATTAATNAAHQAADLAFLNTNKDEMIAANTDIQAQYGCDAGTAAGGSDVPTVPVFGGHISRRV